MKFRPQRGSLEEAMKEVVEISNGMTGLREHLRSIGFEGCIKLNWYAYDRRIDWNTYIVLMDSFPVGFTDGYCE